MSKKNNRGMTVNIWIGLAALMAGLFILTGTLSAQADAILIFEQGKDGYEGAADVQIYTLDRGVDLSKAYFLMWDGNGIPDDQQFVMIRFKDIVGDAPNQIPAGRTVKRAFIRMQVNPDPGGGNSGQIARLDEMLVPFNNGPYDTQPFADGQPESGVHFTEDNEVEIPGPPHEAVLLIDVTTTLNRWISGEAENHGWILRPGGSNGVIVRSVDFKIDGKKEYDGCVDTWVEENDTDRDVGRTSNSLADGGVSGGAADGTWPLIRFDNIFGAGPDQIPLGTPIDSANLRVSVYNGGAATTIHDLLPGHPFNELSQGEAQVAGIEPTTYETFGEVIFDWGSEFFDIDTPLDKIETGFMGPVELDVTSSIARYSQGEENSGWIFSHAGAFGGNNDGVEWRSSDWDNPMDVAPEQQPELIVTTDAGEFRFMDRVNGYEGTVDTHIEEENPDNVQGRAADVLADGGENSGIPDGTWPLMRFDGIFGSDPGQIPPGASIQSAVLRISVYNPGNETTLHDLKPGHPFNDLSTFEAEAAGVETTTFANFGDVRVSNGADFFDINAVLDNIPAFKEGRRDLDVTSSIQRYANGEENTGWIFHHGGAFGGPNDGVQWRSSEWGSEEPPKLIVNTTGGELVFQDGLNRYQGTVDTQVNSGNNAHLVLGNDSTFWSDGEDAGGDNSALLRFDNIIGDRAGQIPSGATVLSAQIVLTITNEGGVANVFDMMPGFPYDDETTTYENFGDLLYGEGEMFAPDIIASSPGAGFTGRWGFDVTATIQRYAAGEPNTGWAIIPDEDDESYTNGVGFFSHEGFIQEGESGATKLIVEIEGEPNEPVAVEDFMVY